LNGATIGGYLKPAMAKSGNDPEGLLQQGVRVSRGGNWLLNPLISRVAYRRMS